MQILNLLIPVLKLTEAVVPKLDGPIGKGLTYIQDLSATGKAVVAAVTPALPAGTQAAAFAHGASAVMAEVSSILASLTAANAAADPTSTPTAASIAAVLTPALQELWAVTPALEKSGVSASKIPGLVSGLEGIYNLLTSL